MPERDLALDVEYDPTIALLVEFEEQQPLPTTKQHLAVDDRNRDACVANEHLPHVAVAVHQLVFLQVLCAHRQVVVFVILAGFDRLRNEEVQPPAEVIQETGLGFVDRQGRGGVQACRP